MPNVGVTGSVTDGDDNGLDGLIVAAYDVGLIADDRLGYTKVSYVPQSRPDLKLRVFNHVGRLLFESEEHSSFSEPELNIGRIVVPKDVARGWRVTLRTGYLNNSPPPPPADPYPRLSGDNLVKVMVDNELAWSEFDQGHASGRRLHARHATLVRRWSPRDIAWTTSTSQRWPSLKRSPAHWSARSHSK